MIHLLLLLLLAIVVIALICYVLTLIPGMPPWARPVFGLVALIIVLVWLLGGGTGVSIR